MYGNTSTTAMQPAMPSTDAARTTSPFDGGYEMPSGFGMYTMADDADDANNTAGGLGGAALGSMSSASLYNVPSYYQAGSYGGFPNGGTYRIQSSRRVSGGAAMQASPSTTHTNAAGGGAGMYGGTTGGQAVARAIAGASMRRSDYGGMGGSAFDDDDTSDFYGGGGAGGTLGGVAAGVGQHLLPNGGGVRSGATTATSMGDCHLSRKDDGGFTPQTDNTFLRSHGSLGGGSIDSRGGDRSALSDGGLNTNGVNASSAYDTGFFSANVSRHGSDFTASQPLQQRRLSDPPLSATHVSSSSTISTVSAGPQQEQRAQQESGQTTSARLSKSGDHVAPMLAASPTPRVVSRHMSPQRSATGPKSAVSMPRRSGSFHRLSGTAEDIISAPFYETERNKSPVSTPPAPTATATTAAATPAPPPAATTSASNSPRKAPIVSSAAPAAKPVTVAATAAQGTATAKAPAQASSAILVLPSVSDKPSALGRSLSLPSRATTEAANAVATATPAAAAPPRPVLSSTSEVPPVSERERKMRTHIEGVEEVASSHSGDSATRKPRTPPSRKPAKDKTTPPSKHTGTVLPPAFSAATTTATHPATSTIIEPPPGIANNNNNSAQRRIGTHTVLSSASTSAVTGTADSKDATLSSLSPIQLSQTMQAAVSQQQQQQPLPQPPQSQMAFTVAPPPPETRDPKRYYRRHHLQPSVAPLSATEVSKPVGAQTATTAAAATSRNADASLMSTSVSTAASPLTASKRVPSARDTRLGASLLSNRSPMAVNNLVGNGVSSGVVTTNNSPHVNNGGAAAIGGNAGGIGKTQRLPATSERRRMSSATGSIVPQTNGTDSQTNSVPQRKRSGSETHSLHDIAGTAQTRSCPSMELSMDEGTNPYLQRRSSSWSAHSTVCSSDSGEGSHTSSVRRKRQQDRMLPSVEEEMERYSMARFGVRF